MAQDHQYGYQQSGFNIDLSRKQLERLRFSCFQGKSIRQLFLDLPSLTSEQCVTIGLELSIPSIMVLKHMEYFLDCGGITKEYLETITIPYEGESLLSTIAAYSRSSHVFSHAAVINSELSGILNLSAIDFIEKKELKSEETQQIIDVRDGGRRYKFDRNRFTYVAQAFECNEYLFPVSGYDA